MWRIIGGVFVTSLLMIGMCSAAMAEDAGRTAEIVDVDGDAKVRLLGSAEWVLAEKGMVLAQGDTVKTGSDSTMTLRLDNDDEKAYVELDENSKMLISRLLMNDDKGGKRTLLDLPIGEIMIEVDELSAESKFEVKTPSAVAGVRGTKFSVRVEAIE